jgi:L-lactate dehydrogenase (cytochrome)/(S)-mandelate dehydrogenase
MGNLEKAVTISDLRELARRRLPEFAFIPMDTGSGDGSGPRRNIEAFRRYLFNARALVDVQTVDQSVQVFGRTYSAPFGISAVGFAGNLRRGADEALAEAAVEANIPFILSGGSNASIETIAKIAPNHVWQQLYAARDDKITDSIVGRAHDAGVNALVFTADSPVPPRNDWLARAGIALPVRVRADAWPYVLWQAMTHPAWSLGHALAGGLPRVESWAPYAAPGSGRYGGALAMQQQSPNVKTWEEAERLRRLWPGKLVIKGLVDAADARRAFDLGADAITVSNHGGNKLECMAAAIDILPAVASDAGQRGTIFFDGGVRKGSDILVARALGASFTFVARPTLYGVVAGGRRGAARAIAILREEITRALMLIGCPSFADMSREFVHVPSARQH